MRQARVALVCLAVRLQGLLHWRSRRSRRARPNTKTFAIQIKNLHNTHLFTMQLAYLGLASMRRNTKLKQHEWSARHHPEIIERDIRQGFPSAWTSLFSCAFFLKLGARSNLLAATKQHFQIERNSKYSKKKVTLPLVVCSAN